MATPQELAQQIVDRNAQAKALMAEMETQARNAASARLAPYGDTLSMYENRFNEVYNPQMVQSMGQLNAAQQYATGLGDLLVRRAREARSGKSTIDPNSGQSPITLEQLLAFFTPPPAPPRVGAIFESRPPGVGAPVTRSPIGQGKVRNMETRFG